MAFSSTARAPAIAPELARGLLLPHLPRRLRLCLTPGLRTVSATIELAAEIATLAPEATELAAAWVEAIDLSGGGVWRDANFVSATATLIDRLDALAAVRDLPALAALADAVVLVSRPGEDRAAAARLAPALWTESDCLSELKLLVEPIALTRALMAVAEPNGADTNPRVGEVAPEGDDFEDGDALDRYRDAKGALELAWGEALDAALLELRADAAAAVAGAATLAAGAGDDFVAGFALATATVDFGRRLTAPVEERVRRTARVRQRELTQRVTEAETALRRATSAAVRAADTQRAESGGSGTGAEAVAGVPPGHLLAVPPVRENPADKSRSMVRGYESIVGKALPLAVTPDLSVLRTTLVQEFPYAVTAIDTLLSDLAGRSSVRLRPTILVGAPGTGKSRLGSRVAELLRLGPWRVDGSHDGASFLGGTDRRWTSAEPAHPLMAMNRFGISNPLILIDEIEKAATRTDHGRLWDALLIMLEPSTAQHYMDPAFQVEVDLSHVSWLATANRVENLPGPLLDRMRVITVTAPGPADLAALLPAVLIGIARSRGIDQRFLPSLDGEERRAIENAWRGGSVRQLTRLVEAIVILREEVGPRH